LLRHDGSLELIERGCHRKAMFWIAGARSRCQKGALRRRARGTKRTLSFKGSYQEMVGNLGMTSFAEIRRRSAEVKRILPRVWKLAEAIIAANQEIEHD
jgi:hypothetical protein